MPGGQLDAMRFHGLVSQCRAGEGGAPGASRSGRRARRRSPGAAAASSAARSAPTLDARRRRRRRCSTASSRSSPADARPRRASGAGLREWGLPFAADAEITRHVADFLARQRAAAGAGGARARAARRDPLQRRRAASPAAVRDRIADVIGAWHAPDGELAPGGARQRVAAARRGARRRVLRAGAARARRAHRQRRGTQLLPRARRRHRRSASCRAAWRRARRAIVEGHDLELLTNRPVAFPLFTATDRSGEHPGDARRARPERAHPLPPIRTVLRFGRKLEERALPVQLESQLTEIGTLALWCRSRTTDHRWRLEFRLRDTVGARGAAARGRGRAGRRPGAARGRRRRVLRDCLRGRRRPGHADAPARDRARRRSRRVAAAGDPCALGRAVDARAGARADPGARGALAEPRRLPAASRASAIPATTCA